MKERTALWRKESRRGKMRKINEILNRKREKTGEMGKWERRKIDTTEPPAVSEDASEEGMRV